MCIRDRVKATDADEGINAVVSYSLPDDVPFSVDPSTGEIKTRASLDYEDKMVNVVVILLQLY